MSQMSPSTSIGTRYQAVRCSLHKGKSIWMIILRTTPTPGPSSMLTPRFMVLSASEECAGLLFARLALINDIILWRWNTVGISSPAARRGVESCSTPLQSLQHSSWPQGERSRALQRAGSPSITPGSAAPHDNLRVSSSSIQSHKIFVHLDLINETLYSIVTRRSI